MFWRDPIYFRVNIKYKVVSIFLCVHTSVYEHILDCKAKYSAPSHAEIGDQLLCTVSWKGALWRQEYSCNPPKKRLGNQLKNNSALTTNVQGMPGIRTPLLFYKLSLLLDHSAAAALHLFTTTYKAKISEAESLLFEGSSPNPKLFRCKPFACHYFRHFRLQWKWKNIFYYWPVNIKLLH